nr:MAG TPA: hypothetical protein [Caudoviricetes sp.]
MLFRCAHHFLPICVPAKPCISNDFKNIYASQFVLEYYGQKANYTL